MASDKETASATSTPLQELVGKLQTQVTSSVPLIAQQQEALKQSQEQLRVFAPILAQLTPARQDGKAQADAGAAYLASLDATVKSELLESAKQELETGLKAIMDTINSTEGEVQIAQGNVDQSLKDLAAKEAACERGQQKVVAANAALKDLPNTIKLKAAAVAGAKAKIDAAYAAGQSRKAYVLRLLLSRDLADLKQLIDPAKEQGLLDSCRNALSQLEQAKQDLSNAKSQHEATSTALKDANAKLRDLRAKRDANIEALSTPVPAPKA